LLTGAAFWPSFAEAMARGDVAWAMTGLRRFIALSLVLVLATALPLIPFGATALRWWVGGEIAPPAALFSAFACFWIIAAMTQPLGVFSQRRQRAPLSARLHPRVGGGRPCH
jgi:O-antigen/teichoic acid export membrane protein